MSADQTQLAFEWNCRIMSDNGCGFPAPGLHSFLFQPIATVGGFEFNKVMLLALITTLHRQALPPGGHAHDLDCTAAIPLDG